MLWELWWRDDAERWPRKCLQESCICCHSPYNNFATVVSTYGLQLNMYWLVIIPKIANVLDKFVQTFQLTRFHHETLDLGFHLMVSQLNFQISWWAEMSDKWLISTPNRIQSEIKPVMFSVFAWQSLYICQLFLGLPGFFEDDTNISEDSRRRPKTSEDIWKLPKTSEVFGRQSYQENTEYVVEAETAMTCPSLMMCISATSLPVLFTSKIRDCEENIII